MASYSYYQYQTQAQQQQQQTSAANTGAMTWNGTAWVPAAPPAAAAIAASGGGEAPPPAPEAPPGHSAPPPNSTPQAYVSAYSTFYQEWKVQSQQQSQLAASLPPGTGRDEAERRAQWAEYYADQSSRCAHYYNTVVSRGSVQQQQQPPPYQAQQYGQYGGRQQQQQQQPVPIAAAAVPPPPSQPAASSSATGGGPPPPPPESMKRFVHRCLAQCTTDVQRKQVQSAVETIISDRIREGTLHTTDWDRLDCVAVREDRPQQQQQQHHSSSPYKQQQRTSPGGGVGGGYYGPASGGGGGGGGSGGDVGGSYYGPSAGSSSFGEDQSDFIAFDINKKNKGKNPKGKRGHNWQNQKGGKKRKQARDIHSNDDYYSSQSPVDGFERSDAALTARQARFSGRGGLTDTAHSTSRSGVPNVERYMGKTVIGGTRKLDEADFEAMTVKGTCSVLEKEYLRLTAPPRAELVRPEPILKEHLSNLKKLWVQPEEKRGPKRDYVWFCSQFKAMRQDLTVQRIFNSFSVDTYETHARIALEQGDINEFNQCQTQLKELYEKLSHDPSAEEKATGLKNETEFIAYRILYYIFLAGNKKYEGGSSDMMKIMLSLSTGQRDHPIISHALKVRVAIADYDYHAFFKLQDICPNMGAYLMDYLVPSVRQSALQRIQKAFKPSIPVDHVLSELGFDMSDPDDIEEGKAWLVSCDCKLSEDGKTYLTKDSVLKESDLVAKKSSLI